MRWLHHLMGEGRGIDAIDLDEAGFKSLSPDELMLIGAGTDASRPTVGMPRQMVAARFERFIGAAREGMEVDTCSS